MIRKVNVVTRVHAGGHWLSFDPGVRAGLAVWDGACLVGAGSVGRWSGGAFLEVGEGVAHGDGLLLGAGRLFRSFERLMGEVVRAVLPRLAVCERGFGASVPVKVGHAYQRGVVAGLLASVRGNAVDVTTDDWRRAVAADVGPWGRGRAMKGAAVAAVVRLYGRAVTDDVADAVLLGRAALALGLVPKAVLVAGATAPSVDLGDAAESLVEVARRDAAESGMD